MYLQPTAWQYCLASLLSFTALAPAARAEEAPAMLKPESPYFFVKSDDPATDRLPLKDTKVNVNIAGVIADVTVTQRYKNEGTRPIEARYVFPGSTHAAVYGMNVRLGQRLITAVIKEKQQARVEYTEAKKQGKTAALLEQDRPNVFQMNVANIMPGDDVQVELHYTELMVPQDGKYQFVYPTVVGPRYTGSREHSGSTPAMPATGHLRAGEAPVSGFDLKAQISSPIVIAEVGSNSHTLDIKREDAKHMDIGLAKSGRPDVGRPDNNRDFILEYRLGGEALESGLMLYKGLSENFFLAMVSPPKAVSAKQIPPRDYVFVVDVSGSMNGFPLDTSKALLRRLIGSLRPSDTFNVLLFSGGNAKLGPRSVPASPANIARAINLIDNQQGGGGTELLPALRETLAMPNERDRSRSIVVVTDGYVDVEQEAFDLIRNNLNQANLFAFGIGSSVNRHLIEDMARAGQGEPFIVTQPEEAAAEANRLRQMIDSPVLTHIRAQFQGLDVYDVEPPVLADVMAQRPIVVFGKWRGEAKGQLLLTGYSADGYYQRALKIGNGDVKLSNAALRYLWARHRITRLSDELNLGGNGDKSKDITELGLKYNLLTDYTSFLAVDQVVRNTTASSDTVDQPSAMPEGVSNLAIGAEVPSTPEPATWAMLGLSGGIMGVWAWRRRQQQKNLKA